MDGKPHSGALSDRRAADLLRTPLDEANATGVTLPSCARAAGLPPSRQADSGAFVPFLHAGIEPPSTPVDRPDPEVEHDADLDTVNAPDRSGGDLRSRNNFQEAVDEHRRGLGISGTMIGSLMPAEATSRLHGGVAAVGGHPEMINWHG